MSRIVLMTWGSLGDLHPYIAVARGLRTRGHDVAIASCSIYQAKVEGEGIRFYPYAPDISWLPSDPEVMRRCYDEKTGTEYIVREILVPALEQSYRDALTAAAGADLIVGHPIAYGVPPAAEKLGVPWLGVALQPIAFLSTYDPPYLPRIGWAYRLRRVSHWPFRLLLALGKRRAQQWGRPILELRRREGLQVPEKSPMLEGTFSPAGNMAWFSPLLGQAQPDWPAPTRITGFPFYDRLEPGQGMPAALQQFVERGDAPLVFTLGSSAVMDAGEFYEQSLEAATRLGRRAVLLTGIEGRNQLRGSIPSSVHVAEYAPYSELFPHAAAIIHQGGIGTTAQVLRAGRPALVVPFSHDQPDNAERVKRLGVARAVPRRDYSGDRAAAELDALLSDRAYSERAAEVGCKVRSEDGVAAACDFIEESLHR